MTDIKELSKERIAWGVGFRIAATVEFILQIDRDDGLLKPQLVYCQDPQLAEISPLLQDPNVAREFAKGKFAGRIFRGFGHTANTSDPDSPGSSARKIIYGK
ncbi:MAG: hypothetical protein V1858_05465 [Candidatus Gottesmanbacteria bacterium]